ncbi:hypothetical protein [Desulfovibrio sp. TomC]|uniref:hypothetical protein n=1 Tax=Desulfovibrio sp. TomC TaxID=1562888 RepID=UPI000573F70B|nr:hypothetical protein [Desulfovibrio sp. TomC]KHK03333.1 hypothetical protein NY78_1397 [Desulfovibrio sp. TomC]
MSRSDATPFPEVPAAARQAMDAAAALAATDPAAAAALLWPLLGQPGLHAQSLVLLIDLCRRHGDPRTAAVLADRAARLAPKSGRARTLAAMALREAGRPEAALGHALAALALTPDDLAAMVAVVTAALAAGRPLAGLDAAVALCRPPSQPEGLRLAVGLLDAVTGGAPWGVVWTTETTLAGCVRHAGPEPAEVVLLADGAVIGRTLADTALPGLAPLGGFSLTPPAGWLDGTLVDVVLAKSNTPLFGSPAPLPQARTAPPLAAPVPPGPDTAVAAPRVSPQALAHLGGWLRQAACSPQSPPPLPDDCLGAAMAEARSLLAARAAALEADQTAAGKDEEDDDHA